MAFVVYILKSKTADKYYVGSTVNLDKRISIHNSSRARWTKRYQPWVLIHSEDYETRSEAAKRERFLKSLKGIERNLSRILAGEI